MIKFEGDVDGEDLQSVDPRLILPVNSSKQQAFDNVRRTQDSPDNNDELSSPDERSGEPIRMEHCINLDMFLTPICDTMSIRYTDELNTPVMIFDAPKELHRVNDSITHLQPSDRNPFTFPVAAPVADETNNVDTLETDGGSFLLSPHNFDFDDINLDEYDLLTDYQDAINDDMPPHDTNASHAINEHHNYALRLNIDNANNNNSDDLHTPDIINTICSIANDFKLIKGHYVSAEDIKQELLVNDAEVQLGTSSSKRTRAPRRRKREESEDEDYVPPSAKRSLHRKAVTCEVDERSDESESEVEVQLPKRGRPSKAVCRSIESSSTPPACSKYREMRDKNNEASRRSRRKRKVQERTVEVERDELETRNERLKVQVGELEKSVSMYRNNLMAILLCKK